MPSDSLLIHSAGMISVDAGRVASSEATREALRGTDLYAAVLQLGDVPTISDTPSPSPAPSQNQLEATAASGGDRSSNSDIDT